MPVRKTATKAKKSSSSDGGGAVDSKSLNRSMEKSLTEGYDRVIGLDEAGRGPLAGPVVAAACYIPQHLDLIPGIQDSKLLDEAGREAAYEILVHHPEVKYSYSVVDHIEIDNVNILQASMNAMSRSTTSLLSNLGLLGQGREETTTKVKGGKKKASTAAVESNLTLDSFVALVDGNRIPTDLPIPGKFVIQGDRKIYSIAAASIIAKVVRDRLMVELDKEFPQYLFAKHKGYPTFEHRTLLFQHGPCKYHRKTYGPVRNAIEAQLAKEKKAGKVDESEEATPVDATKKKRVTKNSKKEKEEPVALVEAVETKPRRGKKADVKAVEAKIEEPSRRMSRSAEVKVEESVAAAPTIKRGRKRKADDIVSELPAELKVEVVAVTTKKGKKASPPVSEAVLEEVEAAPKAKRARKASVEVEVGAKVESTEGKSAAKKAATTKKDSKAFVGDKKAEEKVAIIRKSTRKTK